MAPPKILKGLVILNPEPTRYSSNRSKTRSSSWYWLLVLLAFAGSITGCGKASTTATQQERYVSSVQTGNFNGVEWNVDIVQVRNTSCLRAQAAGQILSMYCDFPVSETVPVNFAYDAGDDRLAVIFGAIGSNVKRLGFHPQGGEARAIVIPAETKSPRYFAFAATPSINGEVVAYGDKDAILFRTPLLHTPPSGQR